jgi:hypothetical protein
MADCTADCSAPSGDDAYLCRTHTDTLVAELRDVPDLYADLDVTITRQNRTTAERNGGRSSTRPLPWNEYASEARTELWSTLNAWALDVSQLGEDERDHLVDVNQHDVPGVARWLVRNIATLRLHAEAGTAHAQIIGAIHRARQAVDRPPDEVTYGPCLYTEEGRVPCQRYLYGPPGKDFIRCRQCGAEHSTAARKEWMLENVRAMTGTAVEVSAFLTLAGIKVTVNSIRSMATRGRIPTAGTGKNDRTLYRFSDVIDAAGDRYKRREKVA